jgi:hypothetical protein
MLRHGAVIKHETPDTCVASTDEAANRVSKEFCRRSLGSVNQSCAKMTSIAESFFR